MASNHVSGNARVGFQADEITVTGGLHITMPSASRRPRGGAGGTTEEIQQGPANKAGTATRLASRPGGSPAAPAAEGRTPVNAVTYTHPSVLEGIRAGADWADPVTDPRQIDWAARQARAAIPFAVVDGRPANPVEATGIRHGRNELGRWGEARWPTRWSPPRPLQAVVRCLLMVERGDGYGWAVPGGDVEAGETGPQAAVRELAEETGLERGRWPHRTSRDARPVRARPAVVRLRRGPSPSRCTSPSAPRASCPR